MKICLIIPDEILLSTYAPDKKIPIIKGKIQVGLEVPLLIRQTQDNTLNKISVNDSADLNENQKRDIHPVAGYMLVNWFCISECCLKIVPAMQPRNFQLSQLSQIF